MSLGSLLNHSKQLALWKAATGQIQTSANLSSRAKTCHPHSKRRRRELLSCRALSSNPVENIRAADKKRSLLRFVQDVESRELLDDFHQSAPLSVMDAIRTAVTNLLGTLPPSYFNVTVSATQEDMAQIMYSALMMGYMYRNAQYRIDLDYDTQIEESSLSQIDFEALQRLNNQEEKGSRSPQYADGVQVTHVSGEVVRWRTDVEKAERFDAQNYIKDCESEIASLRDQVSKLMYQRSTGNELLDFIKVQDPVQLKELTQHISTPVIEAMNSFVERLIGREERRVEARNPELATTFYILIVVGYYLRQIELSLQVKCDFESSFTVPALPENWE